MPTSGLRLSLQVCPTEYTYKCSSPSQQMVNLSPHQKCTSFWHSLSCATYCIHVLSVLSTWPTISNYVTLRHELPLKTRSSTRFTAFQDAPY